MNQPAWRKSSHSGGGSGCVDVWTGPTAVFVRDSKDTDGPQLTFTHDEWAAFIAAAKDGQFDLPEQPA